MGLFDVFRRTKQPPAPFDFPHTEIRNPTPASMLEAWKSAPRNGGVPVVIVWDDLMQSLWNEPVSAPGETDPDAYFAPAIDELQHDEESMVWLGEPSDDTPGFTMNIAPTKDAAYLAHIPVDEPWQIFRRIPYGGWNECPDGGVCEAFLKRLYNQYGAVPAVIRGDTLELVPARRPKGREACELAIQFYAFCPDIVMQGAESVWALAHALERSDVWQFWWD